MRAHALRCDAMQMILENVLKRLRSLWALEGAGVCSRLAAWTLGLMGLGLVSGCAGFDAWSRTKVYRPTPILEAGAWERLLAGHPGVTAFPVALPSGDQQVTVLSIPANPDEISPVRVLYLHGTFRHAFRNLPKTGPMTQAGLDVFMPDYRGWGVSSSVLPSEASIDEDALAVWQALQGKSFASARPSLKPVRWVVYGHSMGSAVAVKLAARLKAQGETAICGVVLESSFTSFSDVAYEAAGWPGRWLVALSQERMRAEDHIADIPAPVWFLHGEADKTVPMRLGKRLFQRAPEPKHWLQWPLQHSNLHTDPTGRYDQTWEAIKATCLAP